LAKETGRNYSNVHADITKLLELELVARDEKGRVFVPWDDVEISVSLNMPARRAA
jgi:predicted transcriptional regulator